MNFEAFVHRLLEWYPHNRRDLPWRNTQNPYIIWLSEIILQQTRVAQGLPYFEKFLQKYPNVEDLANAPAEEVMRLWQGLGYYSRARNLHQCAKEITEKYGGDFPGDYKSLLKLKGVGSYTAAAIASFAFGEKVAVVDGNVFRVLSRYFGVSTDIASSSGKKEFESLANNLIPEDKPGEFNQAIMEFGALQCIPKNPDCEQCLLKAGCFAYKHSMVGELPVKINKLKIRERHFLYSYIVCGREIVVKQRGKGDIWEGLFDFPMAESNTGINKDSLDLLIANEIKEIGTQIVYNPDFSFKHILTHQRIFATFVKIIVEQESHSKLQSWANEKGYRLVDFEILEKLAKPRLILKFLNEEI